MALKGGAFMQFIFIVPSYYKKWENKRLEIKINSEEKTGKGKDFERKLEDCMKDKVILRKECR